MATVKITNNIREDIQGVIQRQFLVRQTAIEESATLNSSDSEYFTQCVINMWLEENGSSRAKFEALPMAAYPTNRRCRVNAINGVSLMGFVDRHDFANQIHVPHMFAEWSGTKVALNLQANTFVSDVVDNVARATQERSLLFVEREQMLRAVQKVLETFPTLNKAIEYWPPLEALLTEPLRDRLSQKTERKKSEQDLSKLEDISLDNLNVSLVRNKLATA